MTPSEPFLSYIMAREQIKFRWDDDFCFVLDKFDFYSASSLKQQTAGKYVASLRHIILILHQPVIALTPE